MHEPDRSELLNEGLRRKLAPSEEAQLQKELETAGQTNLDEELHLNQLVRELPDAPLPSNFTAQVVQLAARENQSRRPEWRWAGWVQELFSTGLRKATAAGVALSLTVVGYWQYQMSVRESVAQSLATISDVAVLPSVDMLKDFDAINQLEYAKVDFELLQALDLDL